MTLEELYDAEVEAYRAYVRAERGEDLVSHQRVSPQRVERLRDAWLVALRAYVTAGGTYETTRDILAGRASTSLDVRRAR